MDGVLIDSEPLHKRAKERAFGEIRNRAARIGLRQLQRASGRDHAAGDSDGKRLARRRKSRNCRGASRQIYEEIEHELQAVDGAVEFVEWAASRYRIALATSATARNREATFQTARHRRSVSRGGGCERASAAEARSGSVSDRDWEARDCEPAECWIIEDSVNGLRAAKAAGCFAVAITTTSIKDTLVERWSGHRGRFIRGTAGGFGT